MVRNLAVILSFVCVLAFSIFYNNKNTSSLISITIQDDCLINKMSCKVFLPDKRELFFDLKPKGLPVMEPLWLGITGLDETLDSVKVWFEGLEMSMGQHFMLPVKNESGSSDTVVFKGMIPVCSIDENMVWLLNVEISSKEQVFKIQFQL